MESSAEPDEATLQRLQAEAALTGRIVWFPFGEARGVGVAATGTRWWWFALHLHREIGAAVEYADGSKEWWREGKRYNEDGTQYKGFHLSYQPLPINFGE